jgi:hypothetical protein
MEASMGGFGSGRWQLYDKRQTVEDCSILDIGVLNEFRLFSYGFATDTIPFTNALGQIIDSVHVTIETSIPEPYVILRFGGGHGRDIEQTISLKTTEPHFGGVRWWFCCACGNRVGKLYRVAYGRYFRCRGCNDLTYTSCQKSHVKTMWERMAGN